MTPCPVQARPGFVTGLAEWELMPWAKFSVTEEGRRLVGDLRAARSRADGSTTESRL